VSATLHGGGLTLFSDNHKYMQQLARTLAELLHAEAPAGVGDAGESASDGDKIGEPMFSAEAAKGTAVDGEGGPITFENVDGVRLYHGGELEQVKCSLPIALEAAWFW
jgi:hypothetical protein